jgi:hypothetical protein
MAGAGEIAAQGDDHAVPYAQWCDPRCPRCPRQLRFLCHPCFPRCPFQLWTLHHPWCCRYCVSTSIESTSIGRPTYATFAASCRRACFVSVESARVALAAAISSFSEIPDAGGALSQRPPECEGKLPLSTKEEDPAVDTPAEHELSEG